MQFNVQTIVSVAGISRWLGVGRRIPSGSSREIARRRLFDSLRT
jgi:hypothetical protein